MRAAHQVSSMQMELGTGRTWTNSHCDDDDHICAGLNFAQGVRFIHATLARDQNIVLNFELVAKAIERVAQAQNGTLAAYGTRLSQDPDFFVINEGYSTQQ